MKRMSTLRNSVANDTVPEDEEINHQTGSDGKSDDTASSQGVLGERVSDTLVGCRTNFDAGRAAPLALRIIVGQ